MTSTCICRKMRLSTKSHCCRFYLRCQILYPASLAGYKGRLLHLRISAKTLAFGSSVMFPSASSDTDFTTVDLAYSSKTALFTGKAVNRAFFSSRLLWVCSDSMKLTNSQAASLFQPADGHGQHQIGDKRTAAVSLARVADIRYFTAEQLL